MAEEIKNLNPEAVCAAETVVVADVEAAGKPAATVVEKAALPEPEKVEKPAEEELKLTEAVEVKEDGGAVDDPAKKALDEFKLMIREALAKHEFTARPPAKDKEFEKKEEDTKAEDTKGEEEPKAEEKAEGKTASCEVEKKTGEELILPSAGEDKKESPSEPAEPVAEEIKETIVQEVTVPVLPSCEDAANSDAAAEVETAQPAQPEEVSIWGVPLLADEKSDVILLKFLRARDFKVKDAFSMLKRVVAWRKDFKIDELVEEEVTVDGLENVVYLHGEDREGHPVCYNAFGEFQNKDLYNSTFSDSEKRAKFLKWYIRFLEKNIRKLDFSPDGTCSIVQITDLKNSPGPIFFKNELRLATNQALQLLQDNYPEFVAKQVFINVPWWYVAYNRLISPFLTQRTKSKFVFAGPTRTTEILFKYLAPEQVPVQYGGLSKNSEQNFTTADPASEEFVKPACKQTIELPVTEACTLVWEVRVVGWDISYQAEFVPSAEDGYTWIIQKSRKVGPTDELAISCTFKTGEPGKVVLTFDNQTSKKKKIIYRSKTEASD